MFGNAYYRGTTVKTFAACEKLWNESSNRKKAKGSITVGHNTELWRYTDRYEITFHGNTIVTYYPEYRVISGGGYSESITTQGRIRAFTGINVGNNSRCGFNDTIRIDGYPFFSGIRVDNHGNIFPEDIRPDYKEVTVKEVVNQYTRLWKKIEAQIGIRYALGEFDTPAMPFARHKQYAFDRIEAQVEGGLWTTTEAVTELLAPTLSSRTTVREACKKAKDELRDYYYRTHNGYETKEISNG